MDDPIARGVAAEVRQAINDFRDDRRAEMARARDRLLLAVLLTSFTIFAGLAIATIVGIPRDSLKAITAFSVVGSLTGVANAMRVQSGVSRAVDDYGLFEARLLYTLIVSGIAAVGGVLLVGAAPSITASLSGTGTAAPPDLAEIFNAASPTKLVIAIGFGLVPEAFFSGVRKQVDSLRRDLESTTSAGSSPPSPS